MRDKLIKNTLISGYTQMLVMVIGFLLTPYIINNIGPLQYGFISIVNIFMVSGYIALFDIGFQGAIVKYTAEYAARKDYKNLSKILSTSLIVFITIGITLSIIGIFCFPSHLIVNFMRVPDEYKLPVIQTIKIIFLTYLFQFPFIIVTSFLEGMQRFDITKQVQTFTYIIYAITVFILIKHGGKFQSIIFTQISLVIIQGLILFHKAAKLHPDIQLSNPTLFDIRSLRNILNMSSFMWLSRLNSVIYNNIPRILIGALWGPTLIAYYEISIKIPQLLKNMLGFINTTVMPAASTIKTLNDLDKLKSLFIRTLRYQIIFIIPFCVGIIFMAKDILNIWMGERYTTLAPFLSLYSIWTVFSPFLIVGGTILIGINRKLPMVVLSGFLNTAITILITLTLKKYELYSIFAGLLSGIMLSTPIIIYLTIKELSLNIEHIIYEPIKLLLLSLPSVLIYIITTKYLFISFNQHIKFISSGLIWCLGYGYMLYRFFINEEDKSLFKNLIKIKR